MTSTTRGAPSTVGDAVRRGETVPEEANRPHVAATPPPRLRRVGQTTSSIEDSNASPTARAGSSPGFSPTRAQMVSGHRGVPGVRVSELQIWTGYIAEIDDGVAFVRLESAEEDEPDLVGEFDLDLLGERDVEAGDVVYVTSRKVIGQTGYPTHTTAVRLRRSGRWTAEEVRQLRIRAEERAEAMQRLTD